MCSVISVVNNLFNTLKLVFNMAKRQFFAKFFVVVFIVGLLFFTFGRAYNKWVDGFYLKNIFITTPYNPCWEIAYTHEEQEEVERILDQPFYYFAKGRQCYSFVSEDGKYILKFLKCQRMRLPDMCQVSWLPQFLEEWRQKKEHEKQERMKHLFTSYWLARKELSEESGVLYVHLNPTSCTTKKVKLYNKIGMEYALDIGEVPFALQRKAEMVFPLFQDLLSEGRKDEARKRIDQLIEIIACRARKAIADIDNSWITRNNVGFLEKSAMYIDIGTFARDASVNTKEGVQRDFHKLKPLIAWLHQKDPELEAYIQKKIAEAITQF